MRANNVSFNHDSSCVVVATENGFRILKADSGALLHKFDAIVQCAYAKCFATLG